MMKARSRGIPARQQPRALKCWNSQKYGAGNLKFPHAKEFVHALQKICQPSPRPKKFQACRLEGGVPTCLRPALFGYIKWMKIDFVY